MLENTEDGVGNVDPHVVVDADGNVTVLWHQNHPGAGPEAGPYFRRYEPDNGGWQDTAPIDPDTPWQVLNGAVVDGDGAVTVAVSTIGDVLEYVFAYRFDPALGTWDTGEQLGATTRSFRGGPAVDASGNAFVMTEDTQAAIRVSRYDNATATWTLDTTVSPPEHDVAFAGDPNLAVDAIGNAFVVYGALSGVPHTWAVRYDVGSEAWSDAFDLGTSAQLPLVAAQSDGTALAMWREIFAGDDLYHYRARMYDATRDAWGDAEWVEQLATGSTTGGRVLVDDAGGFLVSLQRGGELHSHRYEPGEGFTTPAQHELYDNGVQINQLTIAPGGDAWVSWGESDGTYLAAVARRFDAVLGWEEPAAIDDNPIGDASPRNLLVDGEGSPTVVWRHEENGDLHLRGSCFDAELGAWAPAQDIETSFELSGSPAAVIDSDGAVTVVWLQYADNDRTIWANRFE